MCQKQVYLVYLLVSSFLPSFRMCNIYYNYLRPGIFTDRPFKPVVPLDKWIFPGNGQFLSFYC